MKITKDYITPNKYSRPQISLKDVKKVVVHYTGNPNSTAKNNRDYFNNAPNHKTYVSSHYVVGLQGEVIQCMPETEIAYCSNDANSYSISIETCHPKPDGIFNKITENSLVELVADICKRHKLEPLKDVIRHYDVTGKKCPLDYVDNPKKWSNFKSRVNDIVNGLKIGDKVKVSTGHYIKSISKDGSVIVATATGKCEYKVSSLDSLVADK